MKRMRAVALVIFLAMGMLIAMAVPSSAGLGIAVRKPPVSQALPGYTLQVRWTAGNWTVPMGQWWRLSFANCTKDFKIGNLFSYAFTQERYVAGNCGYGGNSSVYTEGTNIGSNPYYPNNGNPNQEHCVIDEASSNYHACAELSDGSLFNQPTLSNGGTAYSSTNLVGGVFVLCGGVIQDGPSPGVYHQDCLETHLALW